MVEAFKKLCQTFGAGALGGMVVAMVFVLMHETGVIDAMSVRYRPGFYMTVSNGGFNVRTIWFYETVVLFGFFGLIFQLPWLKGSQLQKAGIAMLLPTAFHLLYAFPNQDYGLFGIGLGSFTFVFILVFNFIWALVTVSFASQGN